MILCGHGHLFGELTEVLQGSTLVSHAVIPHYVLHQSPKRATESQGATMVSGLHILHVRTLFVCRVRLKSRIWRTSDFSFCFFFFFEPSIITTRCSGILWILKAFASETCISFISPLSHIRCEHLPPFSLSSCSFSLCFTSVLT